MAATGSVLSALCSALLLCLSTWAILEAYWSHPQTCPCPYPSYQPSPNPHVIMQKWPKLHLFWGAGRDDPGMGQNHLGVGENGALQMRPLLEAIWVICTVGGQLPLKRKKQDPQMPWT